MHVKLFDERKVIFDIVKKLKMEKNNPFKVPDNYFKEFKLEIMGKLPENKIKNKIIFFRNSIMKWSAVASIALILIFIGFGYIDNQNKHLSRESKLIQEETIVLRPDQKYASLQSDYYLFLEDQAAVSIYRDVLNSDDL